MRRVNGSAVYDKQVEDCVIKSIVCNRQSGVFLSTLSPEDFYDTANRTIFSICKALYSEGVREINSVLILAEANSANVVELIGGESWYSRYKDLPDIASVDPYIKRLKRLRALRLAQTRIGHLSSVQITSVTDPLNVCRSLLESASAISDVLYSSSPVSTVGDIVNEFGLESILESTSRSGIPTGYVDIDNMLGGFLPGEMIIIAGRPSMGKSSFLTSICSNLAVKGIDVGILLFSMEMPKEAIINKMISGISKVPAYKIRNNFLFESDRRALETASRIISQFPMVVEDTGSLTVEQISSAIERTKRRIDLGLVAVDYLQLIAPVQQSKNPNRRTRNEELAEISKSLKSMARVYNIPFVIVSQLSRATEARTDKRPYLSDLRECGCVSPRSYLFRPSSPPWKIPMFNHLALDVISQKEGKPVGTECKNILYTGTAPMYRMILEDGSYIDCTRDHRIMTPAGWKEAGNIRIGDSVIKLRKFDRKVDESQLMPIDAVERYGRLFGSGCSSSYVAKQPWSMHPGMFAQDEDRIVRFLTMASIAQGRNGSLVIPANNEYNWQCIMALLSLVGVKYRTDWSIPAVVIKSLRDRSDSPFEEVRVSAIDYISLDSCYDFTCPDTENAVVNGIVVHNSLEYDADKVLFCVRPGLYKPDKKELADKAEIIIAKHRSGPCGIIEMTFNSQLSRFEPLEYDDAQRKIELNHGS